MGPQARLWLVSAQMLDEFIADVEALDADADTLRTYLKGREAATDVDEVIARLETEFPVLTRRPW